MYGEEFINIEISKPEAFELSNNLLLLKLPNFIKIDPKPFHPENYEELEAVGIDEESRANFFVSLFSLLPNL